MEVKLYGKQDEDVRLLEEVMGYARSVEATKVMVVMHQRVPVDARPCQKPGTLTYEFVLNQENVARAARQQADGA